MLYDLYLFHYAGPYIDSGQKNRYGFSPHGPSSLNKGGEY